MIASICLDDALRFIAVMVIGFHVLLEKFTASQQLNFFVFELDLLEQIIFAS